MTVKHPRLERGGSARQGPVRVAIASTHPIQHFCPQYRSLARRSDVESRVFFWSLKGLSSYRDPEFERDISWGDGLLSGIDFRACAESVQQLQHDLAEFDPDWVVVYGYRTPIARTARSWARRNHRRLAYISDTEERHHEPIWRRWGRRAYMRSVFSGVDRFLTVGDANEEFYRACGVSPSRFVRMHFPIDPAMFSTADPSNVRTEFAVADEALMVLSVGKLIPRKRHADLIAATADFDERELHLVLVGSGPEEETLRTMCVGRRNVTLAGFVPPQDLPAIYSASDVYAHVSEMDPHPLAVSEAAAGGCALIVSDAVGSWGDRDDVRPGETGEVVETADIAALRQALARLASDREYTRVLGSNARAHAGEHQRLAHGAFVPTLTAES